MPRPPKAPPDELLNQLANLVYVDPLVGKVYKYYPRTMETRELGFKTVAGNYAVYIKGYVLPRSHLVWFTFYGVWPTKAIRRNNESLADDRIENLYVDP